MNAFWAGSHVVALRRVGPERELVRSRYPVDHAAFLPAARVGDKHLAAIRAARSVVGLRREGEFWRVSFRERRIATRAADPRAWFAEQGIPVLEADVDPVRRWMVDNAIDVAAPRRCYLDIETDDRFSFAEGEKARILCWAIEDDEGNRAALALEEDSDEAERALLRALFRALADYDQVAAWNGDRFDFVRIGFRSAKLAVAVELRRWLWIDHMAIFVRYNAHAAKSGAEKQFEGLEAVARSVEVEGAEKQVRLGMLDGPTTYGMWSAGGAERAELLAYCADDAAKMRKIEAKTGYLGLVVAIGQSTCTLPDTRGGDPTRYVEGFLLRIGRARGLRFASRFFRDDDEGGDEAPKRAEKFAGAFVLEPTRLGLVRDVHVVDFARLYPSVIRTWNMSPETLTDDVLVEEARPSYLAHLPKKERPIPEGCTAAPRTNKVFRAEPVGVLAEAIAEMLRLRAEWDARKKGHAPGTPEWVDADRRSSAYKIAANSFYGVVGSPFSRFFVRDVAESIAQGGRWLIEATMRAVEARGWKLLYSDTDSAFVTGPTKVEFEAFTKELNDELFPKLVASRGCRENFVKLEYEKAFAVVAMFAKKRYAGRWAHYKGKPADEGSEPEIKGIEYKRGDVTRLARDLQKEVVDLFLREVEDVAAYVAVVERFRRTVLEGKLERADVVMSKRLSKPLREYAAKKKADGTDAAAPPHVVVARALAKKGANVGQGVRIEFFVADASSTPPRYESAHGWEPTDEDFDRHYLWEQVVFPPTERLLEVVFPRGEWGRWARSRPVAKKDTKTVEMFGEVKERPVPATAAPKKAGAKRRAAPAEQRGLFAPPPLPPLPPGDDDIAF